MFDKRPVSRQKGKKKFNAFKYKAQEISEDSGVPYSYALKVAKGKITLNEALLKLMRRDRISEIMERYGLPSGIAASVLDNKLEPDYAVNRYQSKVEIASNRTRSCFDEAMEEERTVSLFLFGDGRLDGKITEVETYDVVLEITESKKVPIRKIKVKYMTAPEYADVIEKLIRIDEETAAIGLREEVYPQNRNNFKHWKLMKAKNNPDGVRIIMRDGEILEGYVTWFNVYEVGFTMGDDMDLTLFRHAMHKMIFLPEEEEA